VSTGPPTERRSWERWLDSSSEELHLFTLGGFALAQPLFDLLSRNAGFFVARDSEPIDIVILTAVLSFLVPTLPVLLLGIARRLGHRAHRAMLTFLMVLLIAVTALPAVGRALSLPGISVIALAVLVGVFATIAYFRIASAKVYLTALSPAIVLFPVLFLFNPSVTRLLRAEPEVNRERAKTTLAAPAPVILLILDEISVISLMDQDGQIDSGLFPNFAAFAHDGTWFRNATTVSDATLNAVPAILTGILPEKEAGGIFEVRQLPTSQDYPNTLFSLLGGAYELKVFETATRLCPKDLCAVGPRGGGLADRVRALLSDLSLVYLHVILPADLSAGLPIVTQQWSSFATRDPVRDHFRRVVGDRLGQFDGFLNSFNGARARPGLHFLHVMLPHVPWNYVPSGRSYGSATDTFRIEGLHGQRWALDEWSIALAQQRHLLQVALVDKLVGQLMTRLKERDLYDQSLIILTADHGVSFRPGDLSREVSKTNLPEIMSIPLIVKEPGQRQGGADDRNVQSVDILPTIADVLGVSVPWLMDGHSVRGKIDGASKEKVFFPRLNRTGARVVAQPESALAATLDIARTRRAHWDPVNFYGIGPFGELVGKRVQDLDVTLEPRLEAGLAHGDLLSRVDPASGFVPVLIAGRIGMAKGVTGPVDLAIALNGVISATTRTLAESNALAFSALVAEESLRTGHNKVEVFALSESEGHIRLESTRLIAAWW
jgi:hypothetical protein